MVLNGENRNCSTFRCKDKKDLLLVQPAKKRYLCKKSLRMLSIKGYENKLTAENCSKYGFNDNNVIP